MIKRLGVLIAALCVVSLNALPASADAQDFSIESLEADYYLTRGQDNVSELRVRERIVAVFPDFDQNHGILRAIPDSYQGHSVELDVQSVTREDNSPYKFDTDNENGNKVLKIGDADSYVHGRQIYFIDYTMRGVISEQESQDEFFWDINGEGWQQPFGKVLARVHVSEDLVSSILPKSACYTGVVGSTATDCVMTFEDDGVVFETTSALDPEETLSVVMAFDRDAFAGYTPSIGQRVVWVLLGVGYIVPPLVAVWVVMRNYRRYGRDPRGKGTVVPEYLPPKDVSVLGSSMVLKEGFEAKAISATIIDLAVRHYLKIYEVKDKPDAKKIKDYEVQLVKSITKLPSEEQAVVRMLFDDKPVVGGKVALKDLSTKLVREATSLGTSVGEDMTKKGYFTIAPEKSKRPYIIWGTVLIVVGFIGFPFTLGIAAAGLIVLLASGAMPARTLKGVELRDYLFGLREYMKLAEADRLKVLQSPHGELTVKVNVDDVRQLVKLYERLLPYAMLFGIEKEWAKEFAHLYAEEPDWYSGSGAFHAVYFASSIGNFSTASVASFAASTSSSGSGFSGGAGGGGGGGGGGGW